MKFDQALQSATLVRRYKRFLADIVSEDGREMTVHCPNTGAMTGCQQPGWRVWFTDSGNPKRKYPCTWQVVETSTGHRIGVNSALANKLVREALEAGVIKELAGFGALKSEVAYGDQGSRVDFLLEYPDTDAVECYVEVKSLTLQLDSGLGVFPDAVTTRGQKHLQELSVMRAQGKRAVLFFCVQHTGIERVSVAREVDARYGQLLDEALAAGVEVLAYSVAITPERDEIVLSRRLDFNA